MTRTPDDISALTGLRGFATLWVAAYHFWELAGFPALRMGRIDPSPLLQNGYFSVDIFFVLSAFLVARPFLRAAQGRAPMPSYGGYLWRRVRRVVPAYWANLAILSALIWFGTGKSPLDAIGVLSHLSFLFWYTLPPSSVPFNPVWWTLPIEWWAYFLLPPLALALRRVPAWLWLGAIMAFVLWTRVSFVEHFFAGDQSFWWQAQDYHNLRARFDQFAIGLLAAWYFERGVTPNQARIAGWAGLALFAATFVYAGWFVPRWLHDAIRPWLYLHYTVLATAVALIVLAIASGWRPLARCFESRALMLAGNMSYSLYLWHFPIFVWAFKHAPFATAWPLAARGAVALVLTALATWIAYRLFERPFLSTRARGDKADPAAGQSQHA